MSVVNRDGIRVTLDVRRELQDNDPVERAKSLEMALRIRNGWTVDRVARYYNVHRTTVWRRVRAIPGEAIGRAARIVG